MSRSIKVSSIEQTEDHINYLYRRIGQTEQQARNIADEARRAAQIEAEIRIQSMQRQFDYKIIGLENDMAQMEQNHRNAMKQQANEFLTKLNSTRSEISDMKKWVDNSLKTHQSQINNLKNGIDQLYAKEADEQKRASIMLKDLKLLIKAFDKNVNHRKFDLDNEFNKIKERCNCLNPKDISIISNIRESTWKLWDLEEKILKAQLKFEAIYNLALEDAYEILKTMNHNRRTLAFKDENGEIMKDNSGNNIIVEIDFWTKGEYSKLEKCIENKKTELETQKHSPDLTEEKVSEIYQLLAKYKDEQQFLVNLAVKRGIVSQERRNISIDIIKALKKQSFDFKKMEDNTNAYSYMGSENCESDFREGVFAVMQNAGTGMEITIIISPDEETLTKNHILIQRNDNSPIPENRFQESVFDLRKKIEDLGYKMGEIASPSGTGDNRQSELADVNALKKVGINNKLKERVGIKRKSASI